MNDTGIDSRATVELEVEVSFEGLIEGLPEGLPEGLLEAPPEGPLEAQSEGPPEGQGEGPPEGQSEGPSEGSGSLLSHYLRDLSHLPPLRPREEFERARLIEELELAAWHRMLERAAVLPRVLDAGERVLGTGVSGGESIRRLARTGRKSAASRTAWERAVRDVAIALRSLDLDKLALEAAGELFRGEFGGDKRHGGDEDARDEQTKAVEEALARVRHAKHAFVQANLRLVFAVARRFRGARMALGDLVQEGNIGLLKAVDRFDYRRGYRFSTYATWWIRHAMARALADKGRTVRLPVHLLDVKQRVMRTRSELGARLGREPTESEMCTATGLSPKKLASLDAAATGPTLSLDRQLHDDDDRTLLDVVHDHEADGHGADDTLIRRSDLAELRAGMQRLTPMEADILKNRFGLDGADERTLSDLGGKYHLSRERIRQIQERALGKLRREMRRRAA